MMKTIFSICCLGLLLCSQLSFAKKPALILKNPLPYVLCDQYMCVSRQEGVSKRLTAKYLGQKQAQKTFSQGTFDTSAFTFANGVYCDIKKQQCYVDRYTDSAIEPKTTQQLFGQ